MMRFADIKGNDDIKRALSGMADRGRVPHAMIFHENEGSGALALILAFMQYLNCKNRHDGDSCGECISCHQTSNLTYPDIHFTFPFTSGTKVAGEAKSLTCYDYAQLWRQLVLRNPYFGENELWEWLGIDKKQGIISVAEGDAILHELSLSSVSDGYRAVVVWLPEKMNQQTANMLLKAIEEPSDKTLFLMVTHSPEDVLQTIASRCLSIRVLPVPGLERAERPADMELRDRFGDLMDAVLRRDFLDALAVGEELAAMESREKQKAFCIFAGEAARKVFLIQQGVASVAGIRPEDSAFYENLAEKCSKAFPRKAASALSRAEMLLGGNVNQKILFTMLVSRIFASI